MKVFISHKSEDSSLAVALKNAFARNGVISYLDVLDTSISVGGKTLTDHIKESLNTCTDIIVIMTENTKNSWWVPFEIGMSAQIDMPTASFLRADVVLPSYLSYWPRLKTADDVSKYVMVRNQIGEQIQKQYANYELSSRHAIETREFYAALKKIL